VNPEILELLQITVTMRASMARAARKGLEFHWLPSVVPICARATAGTSLIPSEAIASSFSIRKTLLHQGGRRLVAGERAGLALSDGRTAGQELAPSKIHGNHPLILDEIREVAFILPSVKSEKPSDAQRIRKDFSTLISPRRQQVIPRLSHSDLHHQRDLHRVLLH